jgi:glycosyltransferase involved in cell wall biosynthesis
MVAIRTEPRGLADARNRIARGEPWEEAGFGHLIASNGNHRAATPEDLILPLDADDVLEDDFLELTVAKMGDAEWGIVSTNMQEFGARDGHWDLPPYDPETVHLSNPFTYASLYTRKLYDAVGGYDPAASHEDWDFWIRCADKRPTVRHVPERLLRYRVHEGQSSGRPEFPGAMREILTLLHPRRAHEAGSTMRAALAVASLPPEAKALLAQRSAWFPENVGLNMLCDLAGIEKAA